MQQVKWHGKTDNFSIGFWQTKEDFVLCLEINVVLLYQIMLHKGELLVKLWLKLKIKS